MVRVNTEKEKTQRQHDALDPICVKVFVGKVSGKLAVDQRPGLKEALSHLREGDTLTVQEVDRLGRNLLEGLIVLNEIFEQGKALKVLEGIAAGEQTERGLVLDMPLVLPEDRRRDIFRKTKNGPAAARKEGRIGGHRRRQAGDHHGPRERRESIRVIARVLDVSLGAVHKVLAEEAAGIHAAR